jgi:4-amino-4-deoxy-L-arabinose transferase-like glycosyltransferase
MIHDYLKTGIGTSPLHFAENYYLHYPKVALGIWPPLFHSTAALWMLLFTRTHTSLLLLIAFQGALCGAALACFARRLLPSSVAFLLGLLLILLPAFQNSTSVLMIDVFLAAMEFWAMLRMVEFFRTGSMRDSIWFGVSVSLAMLTKGNANALLLAGVCMLVLTRQFAILQRLPVYIAGIIIILLGGPWQLITLRLFRKTIHLTALTVS